MPVNFLSAAERERFTSFPADLSVLNPNRRKQLAQIGFRSTAQALTRMNKERRYPILLAFLAQLHEEVLDELVELFDRLLQNITSRTERKLSEIGQEIARLAGDKIKLLQALVKILLDPTVSEILKTSELFHCRLKFQMRNIYRKASNFEFSYDEYLLQSREFFTLLRRNLESLQKPSRFSRCCK